jgi:hypothetical protein
VGVALLNTEESLGFREIGRLKHFYHPIGTIVCRVFGLYAAINQKRQPCAWVTGSGYALALSQFMESDFGMCHHLHEVGMAHALKERELQQLVI